MSDSRILIRVDGGPGIGMGHLMRCLRLAREIYKLQPCDIVIASTSSRRIQPLIGDYVPSANIQKLEIDNFESLADLYREFEPHVIITDANLHYQIHDYLKLAEEFPYHVNIHEMHFNHFYFGLVVFASVLPVRSKCACESKAVYLNGADYVMVDPELSKLPLPVFSSDKPINILVSPGGADPSKNTEKLLELIGRQNWDPEKIHVKLVIGPANERKNTIIETSETIAFVSCVDSVSDLNKLFADSDIVITNGGTTIYEALAAGRPSWVIPQNEFENEVGNNLLKKETVLGSGFHEVNLAGNLFSKLEDIDSFKEQLTKLSQNSRRTIDGRGTMRIAQKIIDALQAIQYYRAR